MSSLAVSDIIKMFVRKHKRYPKETDFMELRQLFHFVTRQPFFKDSDFDQVMTEIYVRIANNTPFEKLTCVEINNEFTRRSSGVAEGIFDLVVEIVLDTENFEVDIRDRFTDSG